LAIICHDLENARGGREQLGDILQPGRIFRDGGVADLEALFLRVEGNPDADGIVVLGDDLPAQEGCHQRRDPLLAINQNALAGG
jgi:hypothetical protein